MFLRGKIVKAVFKKSISPEWLKGKSIPGYYSAVSEARKLTKTNKRVYLYTLIVQSENMPLASTEYFLSLERIKEPLSDVRILITRIFTPCNQQTDVRTLADPTLYN